jgi:thiol:disulfide interchange protein
MRKSIRSCSVAAFVVVIAATLSGCVSMQNSNPEIYDTHADGEQLLAEALQTARAENKRVLLDLGANWCSDSQGMFQLLTTNTPIRRFIQDNYVFTMVDVNKNGFKPRNEKLVERLGNPISNGIPKLLILDASGKVLNTDPDERLTDSDHDRPAIVLAYLRKWAGQTLRQ